MPVRDGGRANARQGNSGLKVYHREPMFDIIIPHYGTGETTELAIRCLQSIRKYSEAHRVILVDNASPEFDLLLPELTQHERYHVIRNTKNLGFVKATNQGIAISTADYVVLMNNDTEAVIGWLSRLYAPLQHGCHASGPLTTTPNSWQGRWPKKPDPFFWRELETHRMLAFFCTMFRREVFDKCGLLDEDFGVGFGDDDHYCWKMHQAGFRLALCQGLVIPHHHRSTFKTLYTEEQIHAMQVDALDLFHKKSGKPPVDRSKYK